MATEAELFQQLQAADAAGDSFTMKRLAQQIDHARASKQKDEADTKAMLNPTTDSSFLQNVVEGGGSRFTELGRGIQQHLIRPEVQRNLPDFLRTDDIETKVKESRVRDAPLKETWGGKVGAAIADMAAMAPLGMGVTALLRPLGLAVPAAGAATSKGTGAISALAGGAGTGAAGGLLEPTVDEESVLKNVGMGLVGGGAGAGALHGLGRMVTPIRERFSTGRAETQRLANILRGEDIPVSASQGTGSPFLKSMEDALSANPFAKVAITAGSERQKQAATKAVAKHLGGDVDNLSPEYLSNIADKISAKYKSVEASRNAPITKELQNAVNLAREKSTNLGKLLEGDDPAVKALSFMEDRLLTKPAVPEVPVVPGKPAIPAIPPSQGMMGPSRPFQPAVPLQPKIPGVPEVPPLPLAGKDYLTMRSGLSSGVQKASAAGDNATAGVRHDLKQALDTFAEQAWPDRLQGAAQQWKVLKVMETPGVVNAQGHVNPTKLASVMASKNPGAAAKGGDAFEKLAAAMEIMRPANEGSSTFRNILMGGLANPNHTLGAVITGPAMAAALRAAETKAGQKYFGNRLVTPAMETVLRVMGGGAGGGFGSSTGH